MIAAFLGFVNLENARRGLILRPLAIFFSLVAAYVWYDQHGSLSFGLDGDSLAGLALIFCAASPLLGWFWWAKDGSLRRRSLKLALFAILFIVGVTVWPVVIGEGWSALALSLLTASVPFWPKKKWWQRMGRWRRSRRYRSAERRETKQEAKLERRERKEMQQSLRQRDRLEAKLTAQDGQIAQLEAGESQERARLAQRREEVAGQVRLIRAAQVEEIQNGSDGLRFHPEFGFLMAEAWRVLRAQIARGERIPATENDAFFHQVVAELLEPSDFEIRYFHRSGAKAIAAVNRFLGGAKPLQDVAMELKKLRLKPALLAPEPLPEYSGTSLLEAWLVPHRRYQGRLREDFQEGRHPRQQEIIEFLRERKLGLPSQEEWRDLWDRNPASFAPSASAK